jgi:hypothetical protein|tara:strand:+ start:1760 stop:2104 length:345 start_codon:yes stop_codon:yes gene_type:complete
MSKDRENSMIDYQKIIDKMNEGIILLEYTSLVSGKHKQREVTTCHKYLPRDAQVFNKDWTQSYGDHDGKILCYDLEFKKWDDIDVDTIKRWSEIEGDWKTKMAKQSDLNWDGNV